MKYLIVLILVGLLLWRWRAGRTARPPSIRQPRRATAATEPDTPMQACLLCGLHVPEPEAVRSTKGWYCCETHRHRAEA